MYFLGLGGTASCMLETFQAGDFLSSGALCSPCSSPFSASDVCALQEADGALWPACLPHGAAGGLRLSCVWEPSRSMPTVWTPESHRVAGEALSSWRGVFSFPFFLFGLCRRLTQTGLVGEL